MMDKPAPAVRSESPRSLVDELRSLVLKAFLEGRKFVPTEMPMASWKRSKSRERLGKLLVERGVLTAEELTDES